LIDLRLYLLDFALDFPLIILGSKYIPLQSLNLLHLFLQNLLLGPELILIGFKHFHGMGFQFIAIAHRILQHGELTSDELDLGTDLADFSLHQLVDILASGYLTSLLSFLCLGLELEVVFFL
jgi:hypothetical protein